MLAWPRGVGAQQGDGFMIGLKSGVAALVFAAAAAAGAEEPSAKQVERLVRKSKATVDAVGNVRAQLLKTMQAYDALLGGGINDPKGAYKKLQHRVARTQESRAEILFRAAEMDAEAEAVFKKWSEAAAAARDPGIRQRHEERLAATKTRHAAVKAAGREAADLYTRFIGNLQEQVTYLGANLNLLGIHDVKPQAAKLDKQVQELLSRIDETVGNANRAIAALGPT